MKTLLAVICLLSLAFWSLGAKTLENFAPFHSPEQIPTEDLPKNFSNLEKAFISTTDGESCSATFISNHGHILTALHCLALPFQWVEAIKGAWLLKPDVGDNKTFLGKEGWGSFFSIAYSPIKLTTPETFNPQLVLTGKGYFGVLYEDKAAAHEPEKFSQLAAEGYIATEDFAIIKISLENTPCVPVSEESPLPGDQVWSVGFPLPVDNRPRKSGGEAVSIGTITNGFDDIAPGERELDPSLSPNVLNILKKALNHPNGFYSTLDVFFASSGTGVVNSSNGKLVGIINAIENLSDRIADHYVSGISTGKN